MSADGKPIANGPNNLVCPMLTDMYQITMSYAYWKSGKMSDVAVFDLYFRKNPFGGEFTIFAGLDECVRFIQNFKYTDSDITYLKSQLPHQIEDDYYKFLKNMDASQVTLVAIPEGSVVFPKVPLIRIEGPLPVVQLMETTLLNCVNYASLVATNAARMRLAAGEDKVLLEFGLRRAQGPDGGLSASRYCYTGGFDGTSNVLSGKVFGVPVKGTHAHAFVSSFNNGETKSVHKLQPADKEQSPQDFYPVAKTWLDRIGPVLGVINSEANNGELVAFSAYAVAFPSGFLALVDTYDVLRSGIPNFCAVSLALNEFGYRARGIRVDSGDLAYLSVEVRKMFRLVAEKFNVPWFGDLTIVASNDINEETLLSLKQQGHEINAFGIGTHLVTCQKQPALGCVFKLVQINQRPRMKLSQDVEKTTIPGKKKAYRLFSHDGNPLVDLLQGMEEAPPQAGGRVLCRHPIEATKRAYVSPAKIEELYKTYWKDGQVTERLPSLHEIRERTINSIKSLREDYIRALNPTPYKVSLSDDLYKFMHKLWLDNAPIGELS